MTMALATSLAVTAMLLSKTTHPPAGGNPCFVCVLVGVQLGVLFVCVCDRRGEFGVIRPTDFSIQPALR